MSLYFLEFTRMIVYKICTLIINFISVRVLAFSERYFKFLSPTENDKIWASTVANFFPDTYKIWLS